MINKTNNTQFFIIKMIHEDPYIPFKLILNKTKDEIMEAS